MTGQLSINGIWSGKASDFNPSGHILTKTTDYRFFFRFNHYAGEGKKIIKILVDGDTIETMHDWMSVDGREDNFFDIPLKYRVSGKHSVQFEVYEPATKAADSKEGKLAYTSDKFTVEYV